MMGLARSTFYESPKYSADDTSLIESMAAICDEFEHYGWRRVRAALRQQGLIVNHKKIRRLMREHDLQPKTRRRFIATTDSNHDQPIFPNVAAEFIPDGPNQLWVADITYVAVTSGFVGGFKRSSQHQCSLAPAIGQVLRPASSSPETCEV